MSRDMYSRASSGKILRLESRYLEKFRFLFPLLGEIPKVNAPFWAPRAQKTAETARFGPSAGKTESTAATPPKFASFYPLEFFGLIHKRPGYDPFFAENPFSPADEFVFMGLVVRSCHFDVTACAEARRLAQRAERPLRGLSALFFCNIFISRKERVRSTSSTALKSFN